MLIRKEQFEALAAARRSNFENRMVAHLTEAFPEWSHTLGSQKLAAFVHHGVSRALQYGIRTELHVARYLHVMQAMGADFDTSAEFPWARALLLRSDLNAAEKIDRLRDAAEYHLEAERIRQLGNNRVRRSHAR
jgi:hypothetical protein